VSSFVTDPNGSVRAVLSATGIVSGTARYTPTGVRTVTGTTTAYGWDGEWADPATGYVYLRGRWYDPTTGQFTTRDPLEDLTRQAYTFGSGDPINAVDPTGLGGLGGGISGELAGGGSTSEGGGPAAGSTGPSTVGEDAAPLGPDDSYYTARPDWVEPSDGVGDTGPGKAFSPALKDRALQKAAHEQEDGIPRCNNPSCGVRLTVGRSAPRGGKLRADMANVDHDYPRSRGGAGSLTNAGLLCRACNMSKGNTIIPGWQQEGF
jgi:RHS repeat-associated protein